MPELHLFQLRLRTPSLFALGDMLHLPSGQVDLGYLVHAQLGELFREEPPRLFALPHMHRAEPRTGAALEVLGYSTAPGPTMLERARQFASARHWSALVDEEVHSKPMPRSWAHGQEVGFELRACPVVRTRRLRDGGGRSERPRELDAFLARVEANPQAPLGTLNREEIYLDWLRQRFAEVPGVALEAARVCAIRRARLVRRNHATERTSTTLERPDVIMRGRLRISDPATFPELLGRGVGRHRAFGFGMLLLLPPTEAGC